jgi:hypothetical protein
MGWASPDSWAELNPEKNGLIWAQYNLSSFFRGGKLDLATWAGP